MLIVILAIIVIILFVIGISLLYKGSVPSADPKELEALKADLSGVQASREKLKTELESAQKESSQNKQALEQSKKSLEDAQKGLEEIAALKANESKYLQQVKDMDDQLARIYLKADEQAKEALEVINALRKDNESLKGQVAAQGKSDELKTENETLKKQLEEIQTKVTQLQADLSAAAQDAQKGKEGAADLERLKTENQKLQEASVQLTEQVTTLTAQLQNNPQEAVELNSLKQALEQLKSENQGLVKQAADDQVKMAALAQEADRLKTAPVSADAVAQAGQLQAACDDFKKQLDEMRQTVTALRAQNAAYEQKAAGSAGDLEPRLTKMKEVNDFLAKKEKFLQTELTKSRIKAVGLEKICEALKAQLETLTKATPAG